MSRYKEIFCKIIRKLITKGNMPNQINLPPGWGNDALSKFLHDANHNTLSAFVNLHPEFDRLSKINAIFCTLSEAEISINELPFRLLLGRSHASYLTACKLCLSGLLPESYMVLRGCLEAALYGCHIDSNEGRFEVWINRHAGDEERRSSRTIFSTANVMRSLRVIHEGTHNIAQTLYEELIDFGGHPNERSVTSQIQRGQLESPTFRHVYLMPGNTTQYRACLKTVAQVGICALDIFRYTDPNRFETLDLCNEIDNLKEDL